MTKGVTWRSLHRHKIGDYLLTLRLFKFLGYMVWALHGKNKRLISENIPYLKSTKTVVGLMGYV
jgi:hypothetical protein